MTRSTMKALYHFRWIPLTIAYLGDAIYVETTTSRRKAAVIAHKPGLALVRYHP